jgi:endonuclease III
MVVMFTLTAHCVVYRTLCKACAATGECMEVMKAVTLRQNNHEVVENVCESIGYNHQPSAWIEDYCEEIVEDHEGDCHALLYHFITLCM